MGELVVTEFLTLDGVAQAPGGPDEDRASGFEHGGWQAPLIDESSGTAIFEGARDMDALLLGRRTYEIFAAYWPTGPAQSPFTELMNRVPKYVASGTLREPLSWRSSTLLDGDVADAVTRLKQRHDRVHVIGSLDLTQTLLRSQLVDRLELWLYPITLGNGKRLFDDGTVPTRFRLRESAPYPGGAVHLSYERTGTPTYGTMGA
jgi:dihydrofolate reductase